MMRERPNFIARSHRMLLAAPLLVGTLVLAGGCSEKEEPSRAAASMTAAPQVTDPVPQLETGEPTAQPRVVEDKNDLYQFGFAYPAQVTAVPALKAMFDKRLETAKSQLVAASTSDRQEAEKDGFPYRPHSYEASWKVVTQTPAFLSLSAQLYDYTGGAHGMTNFDTLLWDRKAQVTRAPIDLFASKEALRDALQAPFCEALDRQREKKRGQPIKRDSGQAFTECIDPVANTVILGSTDRASIDRIGVLVAPYEAGPYAEGSYEVTLPVTAKVLASVRPEYRESFSAKR